MKMEHDWKVMENLQNALETLMISSGYLDNVLFLWIEVMFSYGLTNEVIPHYQSIHKKYGDLLLKLELNMRALLTADL